jgi:hypothetical protein
MLETRVSSRKKQITQRERFFGQLKLKFENLALFSGYLSIVPVLL